MKPNQTHTPDWTRAKGLLADLKAAVRNSVAAQILLGKELSQIKRKLGFKGGGRRAKELPQRAVIVRNWPQWCQDELGISPDTADRYIACFDYALDRAKAGKSTEPEAFRLLGTPAAELTGDELELLAVHVGRLVKADHPDEPPLTQSQILDELGIKKATALKGGFTPKAPRKEKPQTSADLVAILFPAITRGLSEVRRTISNIRGLSDYRLLLVDLELDSPEAGKAGLMGIEESLSAVLEGDLPEVLKDIREAIESKMAANAKKPVKAARRTRKKTLTTSRK